MTKKIRLSVLIAIAVLFAAAVYSFAVPSEQEAHAATHTVSLSASVSFTYDGNSRKITPTVSGFGDGATYAWTKNGTEISSSKELTVTHVPDGGRYVLTVTENDASATGETFVEIKPVTLYAKWLTHPYDGAPEYDNSVGFTYNGQLQGVYPRPQNAVSGDDVYFSCVGNSSVDSGVFRARITGLEGADKGDYSLPSSGLSREYTVKKATLGITLSPMEILYGDALPSDEDVRIDGFVAGEDVSVLDEKGFVTGYSVGMSVGQYSVGYRIVADNYAATVKETTLTVSRRPITAVFDDGSSFYGDEPTFSYVINGTSPLLPSPRLNVSVPSVHAGVYDIAADCDDSGYLLTVASAKHEILPREIEFSFTAEPAVYGNPTVYSVVLVSGSYADGDDASSLCAEFSSLPASVGVFPVTARVTSPDYSAPAAYGFAEISPKPITVRINAALSVYGEPFVNPSFASDSDFPYEETLDDVGFSVVKSPGREVGTYALDGEWSNPRYAVTVIPSSYVVAPRLLVLTADIRTYEEYVLEEGGSLSFGFTVEGLVGSDEENAELVYRKLNERGTVEKECAVITESGDYVLGARLKNPSGNYTLAFVQENRKFTVYPSVFSSDSSPVSVKLESGFTSEVTVKSTPTDASVYAEKYEKPTDFQSIIASYEIIVSNSRDSVMEVRIPVADENRNYTVAIEKSDGVLTYVPCRVENGNAVFVTDVSNTKFLLWQDDDGTPYALSALILFIVMIIEISVLFSLHSRLAQRRNNAFAAIAGAGLFGFRSSIYVFFALTVAESAVCLVLLIAILAAVIRINRGKRRGE